MPNIPKQVLCVCLILLTLPIVVNAAKAFRNFGVFKRLGVNGDRKLIARQAVRHEVLRLVLMVSFAFVVGKYGHSDHDPRLPRDYMTVFLGLLVCVASLLDMLDWIQLKRKYLKP